jgi:hypothetical protein
MRYESSVTSVSWIPSEAVEGIVRYGFDVGPGHYDDPPPDTLGDLHEWRAADRFRFANQLRAWIEVDDSIQTPVPYNWIPSLPVTIGSRLCR